LLNIYFILIVFGAYANKVVFYIEKDITVSLSYC